MPHRVDSYTMSSHRRDYDYVYDHTYRRPSPPPIATLSHSPSLSSSSIDRSSVSSPVPRRSPTVRPLDYSDPYYAQDHVSRQSRPYHHDPVRDSDRLSHNYSYSRSHHDHRYSQDAHTYHTTSPYSNSALSHTGIGSRDTSSLSYPLPGQNHYTTVGYTDDAATKLSDRVRRRCFNCCTTDTSTWRRSNLSPGKVLCNKCGLFERTHGRARPDQFPHRRGPLATSTLTRPKTPPQSTQLPPISTHVASLAPYHYSHPSIAPLTSIPDSRKPQHPNQLPEIQSWIDTPAPRTSAMSSYPSSSSDHRGHHDHLMPLRPRSPLRLQNHVDMRTSSIHEAVA
ncbi:hypothetical protein V8B97DRAFT_2021212 [Scleroderma yunnanense]